MNLLSKLNLRIYLFHLRLVMLLFVAISCQNEPVAAQEEPVVPVFESTLTIGGSTGKKVGPYITGTNAVYAHEDMNSWANGKKLNSLRASGINAMRYPGGHVVSYWDWEFPFHPTYQEIWKPGYEASLDSAELNALKEENKDRMLLEDYFEICSAGNIEPIVGINMFQGWKFNRTEESISKAVRLVQHCLEQDPTVVYFYLDNEAGHQPTKNNHIPIDDYIDLIPAYSKAIKAVHPEAKLIPNIMHWNKVQRLIQEAGEYWDVYDQHWYYNSGKWAYFDINKWRNEVNPEPYTKRLDQFNTWKNQYGMNHLKFGFLEWNGPPPDFTADSNPKELDALMLGLIQADQLMFFAKNEIHMATAWPMTWQVPGSDVDLNAYNRNLLDRDDTDWISPSATIFKAFSYVQEGEVLTNNNDTSSGLRVLSVKVKSGGYAVLVLNKSTQNQQLKIEFPDGVQFVSEGKEFRATDGELTTGNAVYELLDGSLYTTFSETSFTYFLLR